MALEEKRRLFIALGILRQFSEHRLPGPSESASLLSLAQSPEERSMPLDELACIIVRRELGTLASS